MAEERISNEMIYNVLRSIQEQVSIIRDDVDAIKSRMSSVERRMGDVLAEVGRSNERMDRIDLEIRSIRRREQVEDALITDA